MAAFASAIAAEHSARLVISVPAGHVAPSVVRTWYSSGGDDGGDDGGRDGDGGGGSGGEGGLRASHMTWTLVG